MAAKRAGTVAGKEEMEEEAVARAGKIAWGEEGAVWRRKFYLHGPAAARWHFLLPHNPQNRPRCHMRIWDSCWFLFSPSFYLPCCFAPHYRLETLPRPQSATSLHRRHPYQMSPSSSSFSRRRGETSYAAAMQICGGKPCRTPEEERVRRARRKKRDGFELTGKR